MDGFTEAGRQAMQEAVRSLLSGPLDVYLEVRDAGTGEPLYSALCAHDVREGDEVTVRHRVGDVQVREI
jgi:hypothetical protein